MYIMHCSAASMQDASKLRHCSALQLPHVPLNNDALSMASLASGHRVVKSQDTAVCRLHEAQVYSLKVEVALIVDIGCSLHDLDAYIQGKYCKFCFVGQQSLLRLILLKEIHLMVFKDPAAVRPESDYLHVFHDGNMDCAHSGITASAERGCDQ